MSSLTEYRNNLSAMLKIAGDSIADATTAGILPISGAGRMVGEVETLRFILGRTTSVERRHGQAANRALIHDLRLQLETFFRSPSYPDISRVPILVAGVTNRQRAILAAAHTKQGEPLSEVFRHILDLLNETIDLMGPDLFSPVDDESSASEDVHVLTSLATVPAQKVAPFQFDIVADRLVVVHQVPEAAPEDKRNVAVARETLIEQGIALLKLLDKSNCDRRLLETFTTLQRNLEQNTDIVQLGILNITCHSMSAVFASELPDAIKGFLDGHNNAVKLYVSQFPDWARFVEAASVAELTNDDASIVTSTADDLVAQLERNPEIVDPEVPKVIKLLKEFVQDPARSSKRATFALLRTLENLVARTIAFGEGLITETLHGTSAILSKQLSRVIAYTLLSLVITNATPLSSVASKLPDMNWMVGALDIVKQQIQALKVVE